MKDNVSVSTQMDLNSLAYLLKSLVVHPERILKAQKRFIKRALLLTTFVLVIAITRMKLMRGTPNFSRYSINYSTAAIVAEEFYTIYYIHVT